jgi:hypothetical protein
MQVGRLLFETIGKQENTVNMLMNRTYEDDRTRLTAWRLKFNPVVSPRWNRKNYWEYDKELYKMRNEIEGFFRRIKAYRGMTNLTLYLQLLSG